MVTKAAMQEKIALKREAAVRKREEAEARKKEQEAEKIAKAAAAAEAKAAKEAAAAAKAEEKAKMEDVMKKVTAPSRRKEHQTYHWAQLQEARETGRWTEWCGKMKATRTTCKLCGGCRCCRSSSCGGPAGEE